MYVDVSINLPLEQFFTYSVPAELMTEIEPGKRVEVPFRKSKKTGLIVSTSETAPKFKTLPIKRVLDPMPVVPAHYLSTAKWISEYYCCSLNEAIDLFVPSGKKPVPIKSRIKESPFYPLNPEQTVVYEDIAKHLNEFYPALIFGVTGSGKTEIYRHLVKDIVEQGKQAIILVPEISLTPQTIERFSSIFGQEKISIINSRITPSNKLANYYRIKRSETPIILGPRSALFTPAEKLGLIIIDEEQEHSYKSGDTPRYHTRQVAFKIAQHLKIPLILGSATPSVETFFAAKADKIKLYSLKKRFKDVVLPSVSLVDMKKEKGDFSKELIGKILEQKNKEHQTILFLNRRGFAPFLICRKCGYKSECPDCSISLTYHKDTNNLNCHYCDYTAEKPTACPQCGETEFTLQGSGTERIEENLQEVLHQLKILRMDRDTTSKKDGHANILSEFKKGKADVLLGTQMIAKGLDFDKVKLVGVIAADISLNLPDFRSGENTFILLTQVAGRSGRKSEGEVVIQTLNPNNYVMQKVKNHDYEGFYENEIKLRQRYKYPPYTRIVRIVFRGENLDKVKEIAGNVARDLLAQKIPFVGPTKCPLERIKKNHRLHIIIKTPENLGKTLDFIRKNTLPQHQNEKQVYLEVDVDPVQMM